VRDGRPVLAVSLRARADVERLTAWVSTALAEHRAGTLRSVDPGPAAPHHHHHDDDGHSHSHVH
jgi:urease accessory protein